LDEIFLVHDATVFASASHYPGAVDEPSVFGMQQSYTSQVTFIIFVWLSNV